MNEMLVTIRGRRWRLVFKPFKNSDDRVGSCDDPTQAGKTIQIESRLRGEHRLEILLHEILHAANWDLDEECVRQSASDAARILTRLGYHDEVIE